MNNYQLKYSKTQVFNTRFAVKDMMGSGGGGGTSPQYIKGVRKIQTDDATIPIPFFLTSDTVNQCLTTDFGISYLQELGLSPNMVDFADETDSLLFLCNRDPLSIEILESANEYGTLINKTDESLEQIEQQLESGDIEEGYICLFKIKIDNNIKTELPTLTILAFNDSGGK